MAYKNDNSCYELLLKLDEEGHYVGCVKYAGNRLGPPYFTILSLSGEGETRPPQSQRPARVHTSNIIKF